MHLFRLFLHLFRNYVYYHFILPKINKRGAGIRVGEGCKIFQKLISGGGDDYSVFESRNLALIFDSTPIYYVSFGYGNC